MNIDPVLMCGKCGNATLHIFFERRPLPRRIPGELAYVDLVYACDVCGEKRIWGSEPRTATAYGRRLATEDFMHAVDQHGLHRSRCAACRGLGIACSECDEGEKWILDRPRPCGPQCPIAEFDAPVNE